MNTFIIATHSTYAQGLYNCLKFFKDDIDNVHYINAYVEDNEFEKSFVRLAEKLDASNLIVLTDMPGGSVNQICFKLMNTFNFHLVSGVNFPLALEMIFSSKELDADEIQRMIASAKEQMIYMNEIRLADDEEDEL